MDNEKEPTPADQTSFLDHIGNWPYAEKTLLETLHPELIERHAFNQLGRALNLDRVIAVVGSGVTNAYGRPAWWELLRDVISRVNRLADRYRSAREKSGADPEIDALLIVQKKMGLTDHRKGYSGDNFPVAFQICEQLEQRLNRYLMRAPASTERATTSGTKRSKATKSLSNAFRRLDKRQSEAMAGDADFRDRIKADVFDESGRARLILESLRRTLRSLTEETETGTQLFGDAPPVEALIDLALAIDEALRRLKRDASQLRRENVETAAMASSPARRLALSLFSPPSVRDLINRVGKAYRPDPGTMPALQVFLKLVDENAKLLSQPSLGFMVQMLACLLLHKQPHSLTRWLVKQISADGESWPEGSPTRNDLTPFHRDPLATLMETLGIDRFITTNYDNDIEHLLLDRGYRLIDGRGDAPPNRGERTDGTEDERANVVNVLGGQGEDFVFRQDRIAELIDFGTHGEHDHKRIMHLHGQALADSSIVVTEADYQALYLRDDGTRRMTDHAMSLVFGANPLLFVGLGMSEPDILRPLRAFSSQRTTLTDRLGVAILPRLDLGDASETKRKADLLTTYGVYAIHYGSARFEGASASEPLALARIVDDLRTMSEHSGRLLHGLYRLVAETPKFNGKDTPPNGGNPHAEAARRAFEYCDPSMEGESKPTEASTRPKWVAKKLHFSGKGEDVSDRIRQITQIENETCNAIPIQFEAELFACLRDWLQEICKRAADRVGNIAHANVPPDMTQEIKGLREDATFRQLVGELTAVWIGVQRLGNAVQTPFFVGALRRVQMEWKTWRDGWSSQPHSRTAVISAEDPALAAQSGDPIAQIRHRIALKAPSEPAPGKDGAAGSSPSLKRADGVLLPAAPASDRFYDLSADPTVVRFLTALQHTIKGRYPRERRLIIALASRGVGKGSFHSALRSNETFGELTFALGLHPADGDRPIVHRAFFNLGLSHEVLSVFDQLSEFLFRSLLNIAASYRPQTDVTTVHCEAWNKLANNRLGRLKYTLAELSSLSGAFKPNRRIVVIMSHAHYFFDDRGEAKNAQVAQLFETILADAFRRAPIDWIFSFNEQRLPAAFVSRAPRDPKTSAQPSLQFTHCHPDDANVAVDLDRRAIARSGMSLAPEGKGLPARPTELVHKLAPVEPAVFLARYFPRVAQALAWCAAGEVAGRAGPGTGGPIRTVPAADGAPAMDDEAATGEIEGRLRLAWKRLQKTLRGKSQSERPEEEQELDSLVYDVIGNCLSANDTLKADLRSGIESAGGIAGLTQDALTSLWSRLCVPADSRISRDQLQELRQRLASQLKDLSYLSGSHRLSLTVAAASIDDIIAVEYRAAQHRTRPSAQALASDAVRQRRNKDDDNSMPWALALERIRAHLDLMLLTAGKQNGHAREDAIIETILSMYTRQHHSFGHWSFAPAPPTRAALDILLKDASLPEVPSLTDEQISAFATALEHVQGAILPAVQESILVEASLIGQPVEPRVLLACPPVSEQLDHLLSAALARLRSEEETGKKAGGSQRLIASERGPAHAALRLIALLCVLDLLVHRCLLMRLGPKGRASQAGDDDPAFAFRFRYATHKAVRRVVYRRIDTPQIDFPSIDPFSISLYAAQPNELPRPNASAHYRIRGLMEALVARQSQPSVVSKSGPAELRAAYGVLRSVYSAGVVSAFHSYADQTGIAPPQFGYLEDHRLLVRWMLRRANGFDAQASSRAPFFGEEIAWLYNECAVLSLMQGKLGDAAGLFASARTAARMHVESEGRGPLHDRIALNRSICDIERGLPSNAWPTLTEIESGAGGRDPVKWIAHGYLGLLKHLSGDLVNAAVNYQAAEERLTDLESFRAASIFARHHADLLRQQFGGAAKANGIRELADRAIRLAANGGHEDVRNLALIAKLKIDIHTEAVSLRDIMATIDEVDRYQRVIGMPRLQVEIGALRAIVMLAHGESHLAADFAMDSLTIATRHGMQLRKITGMLILARCFQSDLRKTDAMPLIRRAVELATKAEFQSALDGVDTLLSLASRLSGR